jgi:hypothetical protein
MVKEVETYGQVLSTTGLIADGVTPPDMLFSTETFVSADFNKRPLGWASLRARRVDAREAKPSAGGLNNLFGLVSSSREDKEKQVILFSCLIAPVKYRLQEDKIMINEYSTYGYPLALGAPSQDKTTADDLVITTSTFDPSPDGLRPYGWFEVRNQRILNKEDAAQVDKKIISMARPPRENEVCHLNVALFVLNSD